MSKHEDAAAKLVKQAAELLVGGLSPEDICEAFQMRFKLTESQATQIIDLAIDCGHVGADLLEGGKIAGRDKKLAKQYGLSVDFIGAMIREVHGVMLAASEALEAADASSESADEDQDACHVAAELFLRMIKDRLSAEEIAQMAVEEGLINPEDKAMLQQDVEALADGVRAIDRGEPYDAVCRRLMVSERSDFIGYSLGLHAGVKS